jgi:hypothetical protein
MYQGMYLQLWVDQADGAELAAQLVTLLIEPPATQGVHHHSCANPLIGQLGNGQ